jgi:hypothetical protein
VFQECRRLHDHAVNAVAALHSLFLDERTLHGMRILGRPQAFQGGHFPVHITDWINARSNRSAIEVYRACTTLPEPAAKAGTVQTQVISQEVQERHGRIIDGCRDVCAVYVQLELGHLKLRRLKIDRPGRRREISRRQQRSTCSAQAKNVSSRRVSVAGGRY